MTRKPDIVSAHTDANTVPSDPTPPRNYPQRKRLSIWKLSDQSDQPVTSQGFAELYSQQNKKDALTLHRAMTIEPKGEQGTVMLMNHKVTIEGAQSPMRQSEFEEKKVNITGDSVPEDFLSQMGLAVTCKKGLKPESPNQDDYSILVDGSTILLGVFDGHGPFGHCVSNYIHTMLPKLISKNEQLALNPLAVFPVSFDKCEKSLEMHCDNPQTSFDCVISGSTATIVLLQDKKVFAAHVGDSRAVLSRLLPSGEREPIVLAQDHKPTLPEEKERIESCNGEVKKLPFDVPYRVFMKGKDFPGLAMSRSIGDLMCREIGVVSEPSAFEKELTAEDEFVLVCSDGVWEFISNQEAVDFVGGFGRAKVAQAAEELAKKAWTRWIHLEGDVVDDITVMVAYLSKEPAAEL